MHPMRPEVEHVSDWRGGGRLPYPVLAPGQRRPGPRASFHARSGAEASGCVPALVFVRCPFDVGSHRMSTPPARTPSTASIMRSPVASGTAHGLYDPAAEHDNCGVAFVVDMHGRRSHRIIEQGLEALHQLDHRGATGAEVNVGDGAGILIQVPDAFLRSVCDFELPEAGTYAVGMAFLPQDTDAADKAARAIEDLIDERGAAPGGVARRARRQLLDRHVRQRRRADLPAPRRGRTRRRRRSPAWTWNAVRSSCASASSTRSRPPRASPSTSRRCRGAPWSTRAC